MIGLFIRRQRIVLLVWVLVGVLLILFRGSKAEEEEDRRGSATHEHDHDIPPGVVTGGHVPHARAQEDQHHRHRHHHHPHHHDQGRDHAHGYGRQNQHHQPPPQDPPEYTEDYDQTYADASATSSSSASDYSSSYYYDAGAGSPAEEPASAGHRTGGHARGASASPAITLEKYAAGGVDHWGVELFSLAHPGQAVARLESLGLYHVVYDCDEKAPRNVPFDPVTGVAPADIRRIIRSSGGDIVRSWDKAYLTILRQAFAAESWRICLDKPVDRLDIEPGLTVQVLSENSARRKAPANGASAGSRARNKEDYEYGEDYQPPEEISEYYEYEEYADGSATAGGAKRPASRSPDEPILAVDSPSTLEQQRAERYLDDLDASVPVVGPSSLDLRALQGRIRAIRVSPADGVTLFGQPNFRRPLVFLPPGKAYYLSDLRQPTAHTTATDRGDPHAHDEGRFLSGEGLLGAVMSVRFGPLTEASFHATAEACQKEESLLPAEVSATPGHMPVEMSSLTGPDIALQLDALRVEASDVTNLSWVRVRPKNTPAQGHRVRPPTDPEADPLAEYQAEHLEPMDHPRDRSWAEETACILPKVLQGAVIVHPGTWFRGGVRQAVAMQLVAPGSGSAPASPGAEGDHRISAELLLAELATLDQSPTRGKIIRSSSDGLGEIKGVAQRMGHHIGSLAMSKRTTLTLTASLAHEDITIDMLSKWKVSHFAHQGSGARHEGAHHAFHAITISGENHTVGLPSSVVRAARVQVTCNVPCPQGKGNCLSSPDHCRCISGWDGPACETFSCQPACGPNGRCSLERQQCICMTGWRGKDCNTPICLEPCVNGACVAPGKCQCISSQYTGKQCERLAPVCGDGKCERQSGESCDSCPADCGECGIGGSERIVVAGVRGGPDGAGGQPAPEHLAGRRIQVQPKRLLYDNEESWRAGTGLKSRDPLDNSTTALLTAGTAALLITLLMSVVGIGLCLAGKLSPGGTATAADAGGRASGTSRTGRSAPRSADPSSAGHAISSSTSMGRSAHMAESLSFRSGGRRAATTAADTPSHLFQHQPQHQPQQSPYGPNYVGSEGTPPVGSSAGMVSRKSAPGAHAPSHYSDWGINQQQQQQHRPQASHPLKDPGHMATGKPPGPGSQQGAPGARSLSWGVHPDIPQARENPRRMTSGLDPIGEAVHLGGMGHPPHLQTPAPLPQAVAASATGPGSAPLRRSVTTEVTPPGMVLPKKPVLSRHPTTAGVPPPALSGGAVQPAHLQQHQPLMGSSPLAAPRQGQSFPELRRHTGIPLPPSLSRTSTVEDLSATGVSIGGGSSHLRGGRSLTSSDEPDPAGNVAATAPVASAWGTTPLPPELPPQARPSSASQ
ncbi:hypothetical protein H696_00323 [Fonticula alba]|uniref:EGF-like domain-containing protein n=1 Tax=Fonticula alba TaxID=691883 RepID=A0A058ZEE6_FONAL|nr:hypothetical protein H696_00323 [Fonticula alba]KCV72744.1 hypothetical protein H696_00323 [Fonticula alba]|eukprot:XP_009492445.1 hypothetical protein H696_00323 [Fonticula alba]